MSILDLKRHVALLHPGKQFLSINICGSSTASGGVCNLTFETSTQFKKHRVLANHTALGRGHSAWANLVKNKLDPVKASESD